MSVTSTLGYEDDEAGSSRELGTRERHHWQQDMATRQCAGLTERQSAECTEVSTTDRTSRTAASEVHCTASSTLRSTAIIAGHRSLNPERRMMSYAEHDEMEDMGIPKHFPAPCTSPGLCQLRPLPTTFFRVLNLSAFSRTSSSAPRQRDSHRRNQCRRKKRREEAEVRRKKSTGQFQSTELAGEPRMFNDMAGGARHRVPTSELPVVTTCLVSLLASGSLGLEEHRQNCSPASMRNVRSDRDICAAGNRLAITSHLRLSGSSMPPGNRADYVAGKPRTFGGKHITHTGSTALKVLTWSHLLFGSASLCLGRLSNRTAFRECSSHVPAQPEWARNDRMRTDWSTHQTVHSGTFGIRLQTFNRLPVLSRMAAISIGTPLTASREYHNLTLSHLHSKGYGNPDADTRRRRRLKRRRLTSTEAWRHDLIGHGRADMAMAGPVVHWQCMPQVDMQRIMPSDKESDRSIGSHSAFHNSHFPTSHGSIQAGTMSDDALSSMLSAH
ncbi:hypothetical protein K466DRAFT_570410 [Polyporus arcularius HHB13444]|uniref:Uncharacterized protein n=1 Tax=Polyporus arcularius HHB13444 TaxID=1314778 RepID=A0A5C3NRY3_9APHY|nr:hypothetical protein K466DRAFT_570410 [Polyporus arcularius HHB13444]